MPGSPSRAGVGDQQYNEVELPSSIEIRDSSVTAGQPGAFGKTLIKKNTRFGPYKGEIIKPGQKSDIDYRYAWEIFEKRRNVLKFTISASDPRASNWMRNVNCARFYEEQNIVSTQEGFSIFYVAMKDIKPGEELLTWFDPQLLKRTQRRVSRGERRKVGYTIELVPWTDEKKFVPEIIETKRARKKKVLGEDMLSFEEDAALMQKSMNSMFRIPRKVESTNNQIRKDHMQSHSHSAFAAQRSLIQNKNSIVASSHGYAPEHKANTKSVSTTSYTTSYTTKISPEKQMLNIPKENREKVVSMLSYGSGPSFKSTEKHIKKEIEPVTVRKRKRRSRAKTSVDGFGRKFIDRFVSDKRSGSDSAVGYTPDNPSLLKPVVIRTKEDGNVEMEDHDETYNILWAPVRQECDDMCQCMDKQGLLKQGNDTSSSIHKGSRDLVVQFTLLPEHQTFSDNNKVIYKCDICECSYNHALSLKRHYLGVHINHRYISKGDAEFCQLETFHNGTMDEFFSPEDNYDSTNELPSKEGTHVSVKYPELTLNSNNDVCTSRNATSAQDKPHSLLCNEAALDSSADEGRLEVPTLSSLARAQCEKNKSSSSSCLSVDNQTLLGNDKLNEKNQQRLSQAEGPSMPCVIPNSSAIEKGDKTEQENNLSSGELVIKTESDACGSNQKQIEVGVISVKVTDCSEEKDIVDIPEGETADDSAKPPVPNDLNTLDKKVTENQFQIESSEEKNKAGGENANDKKNRLVENMSGDDTNDKENNEKLCDERKCLTAGDVNTSNIEDEMTKQGEDSNTQLMENDGTFPKGGKLSIEENQTERLDSGETTQIDGENSAFCSKKDMDKEKENPCQEVRQAIGAEKTQVITEPAFESNIPKTKEGKLNVHMLSTPPSLLPLQSTNVIQTANIKSPSTQQQFLLLVPIGTPASKMPSVGKSTSPCSFNLPQSQGNLPVVVLSSHVSSSSTTMHPQSSKLNPQILAKPCQSLTSVSPSSSTIGQRIALIPHNPQTLVNKNSPFTTSSNTDTSVSTTPDHQKAKRSPVSSQSNFAGNDWKQPVKVDEADQPGDLYRCHMCVLVYKTMGELKHHIKNDPHRFKGGLKQYACPKCSVRFRNKANLARHTLMHHQTSDDKDRKFRCSTCGKGFTTETYLKMHARFHSGKSFPCKYGCVDAFFPNAGSLVKHLRAVHPGLNLKEYLREKKRRERMKQHPGLKSVPNGSTVANVSSGYSMTNPGIGFQAKRGRPKGSKNAPKELKELKVDKNIAALSFEREQMPLTGNNTSEAEKFTPSEIYPPVKKYYPIEKTWQKGSSFFKISTDENYHSRPVPRRRFPCKLCSAAFKSHLFLLKHRSRRHGAGQSVQEYLFQMARDREGESCPVPEVTFQFSPPPSPKTFFSSVNQRGAENMSKYIEGGEDMLKCRKKLCFDGDSRYPFSSPPQLEWTHYNFPPCFKYVRDNTIFYHNVRDNEIKPKVENCDLTRVLSVDGNPDLVPEDKVLSSVISEQHIKIEVEEEVCNLELQSEEVSGVCKDNMNGNVHDLKDKEASPTSEREMEAIPNKDVGPANEIESAAKENKHLSPAASHDLGGEVKDSPTVDSLKAQDKRDSNTFSLQESKSDSVVYDHSKGLKKSPRKGKAEMEEMMLRLNTPSLKALDLEIGTRHFHRHLNANSVSLLDSLNLFSKSHKCQRRKRRERLSSMSACSQLLPSRIFHRSRDQLSCSIFSSPDVKEPRRCSMWQGPKDNKLGSEEYDKFCCPVVESVRLQEVSKKRKEIQEKNDKEEIDIKPKEKMKEDFATSMGLMSRREYDRSYHAQEKEEHCIKPPEIWERYDRIWFGKKGTITVVCSICHRHFSCQELCLRHQLKKHPHIEPSSLEMERDNYVEDMYYYYPMPYGILAQTHLIPEKMPPPELYVCTRCRFPFKNINKLYSHMVVCDPNNIEHAAKSQSASFDRNGLAVAPFTNRMIPKGNPYAAPSQSHITKPHRQRLLSSKYKNYQLFGKTVNAMSRGNPSTSAENKALLRTSVSYMGFSSGLPNRKHGLLYNPSNHTRRRELVHVLDQHQCHGCNLKFKSMSMLERHVKKCSGKDKLQNQKPLLSGVADEMMVRKQHTCRYCNKRFTFIKGVDLHYKRICSVRKIRKDENTLTEEDFAHEEELQRIIEHLNWSKSLNQDSSDIIQGRVKVEEDGTLTRVEKKRGRPFGKSKRIKKKGSKWTTLKYHRPDGEDEDDDDDDDDDDNSMTSGEHTPSVEESLSNESLETVPDESLKASVNAMPVAEIKQEEKSAKTFTVYDYPKPMPRKRGRPFKNSGGPQAQNSQQAKRKRGRPRKNENGPDAPQQITVKREMSLKDSIDFKRGELAKGNLTDAKREKPTIPNTESGSKSKVTVASVPTHNGHLNLNHSKPKPEIPLTVNKPLKSEKIIVLGVPKKRRLEEETSVMEATVKPPPRVRGRPKKFDPSDMESSYKKKKKTDPGYVPFVKRTSRDSLSNDSHTDVEDSNAAPCGNGTQKEIDEPQQKISPLKEGFTPGGKTEHNESNQPKAKSTSYRVVIEKSSDSMTNTVTTEKRSEDGSMRVQSEVFSKPPKDSSLMKQKTTNDYHKPDMKKRKHETSSVEDPGIKKVKQTTPKSQGLEKNLSPKKKMIPIQPAGLITSSSDHQTEGTAKPASQDRHVTVTMASTSPNGDLVQTPVAVRIVTLPLSSLATTMPSKVVSPPSSSTTTEIQSQSPLSPAVTSPVLKMTITKSPQLSVTDSTLQSSSEAAQPTTALTSMTTMTSTATAKRSPNTSPIQNIPLDKKNKSILQPSSPFPAVRQIIPISNQNVLIPPEVIHHGVTPRFIIHSSPRMVSPNQRPREITPATTTMTRHVSPSTVILSTGKVVSLGSSSSIIPGSNVVRNPIVQGTTVVKKINVINPMKNSTSPPTQFLSSPPLRPIAKKGMGVVVEPPKSAAVVAGVGTPSPATNTKSVYYVQTSPLSNQVVMPISTVKTGAVNPGAGAAGASPPNTNPPCLINLKDGQTVPQVQFIPVSLVQEIRQALHPSETQIAPQSEANPSGAGGGDKIPNSQENKDS